jgi:hypothetical protein
MKVRRIRLAIKASIFVLLALTFGYQYMRANKNILTVLELRSASETIDQVDLLSNYTLKFSNQILDGIINSRSAVYFQATLFALMLILEFIWRKKPKADV